MEVVEDFIIVDSYFKFSIDILGMKREKKLIAFDTNFLLIPYYYKIDIFSEIKYEIAGNLQFIVPKSVLVELKKLSKNRGKEGLSAKLAIKILELRKGEIVIMDNSERTDDFLFNLAKEKGAIVCTNDKELKKRIKRLGLNVISLRSKSRICLD